MAIVSMAIFSFSACQQDVVRLSEGTPDHALDGFLVQDTAEILCRYTHGSFPAWTLWRDYEKYLSTDEAQAIDDVLNHILASLSRQGRARFRASERFIFENTTCEPTLGDVALMQSRDPRTDIVRFIQHYPKIPPVVPPADLGDESQLTQRWFEAFQNADTGERRTQTVVIPLERDAHGDLKMPTQIGDSFAKPLQKRAFWRALEALDFETAGKLLASSCLAADENCRQLSPYWRAATIYRAQIDDAFHRDVVIHDVRPKTVSLTSGFQYTAIALTLENHSPRTYRHLLFKTPELKPQFCELQKTSARRDDDPLELAPGTHQGWCILRENTPPRVVPEFWWSGERGNSGQ